jgi:exopolyphosphatase/guanosine-5'-triphosphate,3'-diphosphate pyrophosphatase
VIVAGIDIGSNSVRLLIADVENKKINKIIYEERKITRLAENLNSTGNLDKKAIERTISALFSFNEKIKEYKVKKVKAVATSAVREANNRELFLMAAQDLNFEIEIIDGVTESKLTFEGVKSGLNINNKSSLLLDIGGGSTEFVFYDGKEIVYSKSIPYGVVKLSELFDFYNPVTESTLKKYKDFICENLIENIDFSFNVDIFLSTAGTPTTLAAIFLKMEHYNSNIINGFKLTYKQIEKIVYDLMKLKADERVNIKGLEKGREDLIIPGSLIILKVMEFMNFKEMTVCDYGLREGVTIAAAL